MNTTGLKDITTFLESFAPSGLAEEWDNVGLLLGDDGAIISRILTCLTVTPDVVEEAVQTNVNLIISHHPMPFHPVKKITGSTITGRMILTLLRNGIAVYSPHTAFDSTGRGINQMIAEKLELQEISPLKSIPGWGDNSATSNGQLEPILPGEKQDLVYGVGRSGKTPAAVHCRDIGRWLSERFRLSTIKFCGDLDWPATQVGIACGSAGQFLSDAKTIGCDVFVTGEATFHTCLEAKAHGIGLFLLGHYGSERFAVESLASLLTTEFPQLAIEASSAEHDPVQYLQWNEADQH